MTDHVQRNAAGSLRVSLKSIFIISQEWGTKEVDAKSPDWIPASAGMTEEGVSALKLATKRHSDMPVLY